MPRTQEFIKRSEARILIYIASVANHMKKASEMAPKLKIDYCYLIKLLESMYGKGWIKTHRYNNTTYVELTDGAPIDEAIKKISDDQSKLKSAINK